MPTVLVFPSRFVQFARAERRVPLLLLPALVAGGNEMLIQGSGRALSGEEFLHFRRLQGAWIETDQPARVKQLLGLQPDEAGIRFVPSGEKYAS